MKRKIRLGITTMMMAVGILLIGAGTDATAQRNSGQKEGIRNMKIAFFADALQLTPQESEKFWPVYNQYWGELRTVGGRRKILFKTIRETKATEKELKEWLAIMDAERAVTAKYTEQFKQILPVDKVAKVFVADEDFKNYLIRQAATTAASAASGGGK